MSIWDDILLNQQRPSKAVSRLTRTPIYILPKPIYGYPKPEANGKHLDSGEIQVYPNPASTVADLNNVISHEQVHALLNAFQRAPGNNPRIPAQEYSSSHPDDSPEYAKILKRMMHLFNTSDRAGVSGSEVPAYAAAYLPDQVKGMTQKDVDDWNQLYVQHLPPDLGKMLTRIVQNHARAK